MPVLTVYTSKAIIDKIDARRGDEPRSKFVERLLIERLAITEEERPAAPASHEQPLVKDEDIRFFASEPSKA